MSTASASSMTAAAASRGLALVQAKASPQVSLPRTAFFGVNLRAGSGYRPAAASSLGSASAWDRRVVATQVLTTPKGDVVSSIVDFLRRLFPAARTDPDQAAGPEGEDEAAPMEGRRRVVVVGGTGRVGRHIVSQLVAAGHEVVALVSSRARAEEVLVVEQGLQLLPEDAPAARPGKVQLVEGDITDAPAVRLALEGADAVVCSIGVRVNPPGPEGGFPGYVPGSSPEEVYGQGVPALIRAAAASLADGAQGVEDERTLFDFAALPAPADAAAAAAADGAGAEGKGEGASNGASAAAAPVYVDGWGRFDDVIMGGISESVLRPGKGAAVFQGTCRVEGGGFCASRTAFPEPLDLSAFDGLRLRVKGDGRRFKINLRDSKSQGEFQYQASFDTVNGQWMDVVLPFNDFRAVERSRSVPDSEPINKKEIRTLGLVYSRFQCDGFPNPLFVPGEFSLEVASISAYRAARPQVVLVSSAAVERSARAQTPEERAASIPIVKLNPGGVLSWKLSIEDCLRASGLRYTVVRPTGLIGTTSVKADTINTPFLLESAQGDVITGLISCPEVAAVCARVLNSPDAVGTTFEVRRDELTEGLSMTDRHWTDLFKRLRPDGRNGRVQYPAVPQAMSDAFKG